MPHWITNGVLVAIVAQGLIGLSLVWDKVLLRQPQTKNLVNFVFWLGAISVFGLGVIPFGFHFPSAPMIVLGLGAGVLDLLATYFYYSALKYGEASGAVAVMGGFSPVATVLFAELLLKTPLGRGQEIGFVILVVAGFVMFFSEHLDVNLGRLIPRVILASVILGLGNVLQKIVFQRSGFVPGFVFITFGTFVGALFFLVRRSWREQIFRSSEEASPTNRFWYFVNRLIAGVGAFLTFYAISLASPAVVDALSGTRYAVVFLGALLLTKLWPKTLSEDFSGWLLVGKTVATLLVVAGLALLESGIPREA